MTSKTYSKTSKALPPVARNARLRAAAAAATAAPSAATSSAGAWLPRAEFDELFKKVTLQEPTENQEGEYAIRAKYSLYSDGCLSALGLGASTADPAPGTGGGATQEQLDALRAEYQAEVARIDAQAKQTAETLVSYIMTLSRSLDDAETQHRADIAALQAEIAALRTAQQGYLPLSGGTITGDLNVEGDFNTKGDNYLGGYTEVDSLYAYKDITASGNITADGNITALSK